MKLLSSIIALDNGNSLQTHAGCDGSVNVMILNPVMNHLGSIRFTQKQFSEQTRIEYWDSHIKPMCELAFGTVKSKNRRQPPQINATNSEISALMDLIEKHDR